MKTGMSLLVIFFSYHQQNECRELCTDLGFIISACKDEHFVRVHVCILLLCAQVIVG